MATPTIRRAPENLSFRLVKREDLIAGAEIYMVEHDAGAYRLAHPFQVITLDDVPVSDRGHGLYIHYHCTRPVWEGQCFVPLEYFICEDQDPSRTHYWLQISS